MTLHGIQLVRATTGDCEVLCEMADAFHQLFSIEHTPESLRRTLLPCLQKDGPAAIWLIQKQKELVGYLVLAFGYSIEFGGRDAFVDEVFLWPSYRGQGIGRVAIELLVEEAKKMSIVAMHLEVRRDDPQAQGLYRGCGFALRERYSLMSLELGSSVA